MHTVTRELSFFCAFFAPLQLENITKRKKEKYSNIIANMNLGLIEVDQNESCFLANNSTSDIRFSSKELIGKKSNKFTLTKVSIYLKLKINQELKDWIL
jgi:hypothetical protein